MSRNSRKKNQQRKKKLKRGRASPPGSFLMPHVPDAELVADDGDIDRPDLLKYKYATYVSERAPGKEKQKRLEAALKNGRLSHFPEIDHWGMEEFFWHGVPGDSWNPIDAYLAFLGERASSAIRQRLLGWKAAQIGIWRIDGVIDDYLTLRPWIVEEHRTAGEPLQAISLGIGGARFFAEARGDILSGYLAPWQPERGIHCFMGYGVAVDPGSATPLGHLLGLRRPDLMAEPLPWKASPATLRQHLQDWKQRDWRAWLAKTIAFPFDALVTPGNQQPMTLHRVTGLAPLSPAATEDFGVYFEVPLSRKKLYLVGATSLSPLDVTSANWLAIEEYGEYRRHAGPPKKIPPGTRTFAVDKNGAATSR